ncbi:MAG TPA: 2-isopropylmalate synthase [Polyangiaceae bacterium]|jgi:2-isopropylmalate synthase|nr:2-isopropylmalate synthase [Polyangiaceae bacterium]
MQRIRIFDTTLRDGEQSPGYGMNAAQKLVLARQLDKLGVDVIEAGFPAASQEDLEGVRSICREVRRPTIAALARCVDGDIEACARALEPAEHARLHIFFGTSQLHLDAKTGLNEDQALELVMRSAKLAVKLFGEVEFSPEDATRTREDFLLRIVQGVVDEGVKVVNIPDTVGYTVPFEYKARFELLRAKIRGIDKVTLSTHCHNDLGLGVANSLAAIEGGARQVECTINGIGERAGNASLEELVMALRVRNDVLPYETGIKTEHIYETSQILSALTGCAVQRNKAVVGRNAFAHESGVHQQGMLKDRRTYEIMTPESVGAPPTQIVLGRHSGRRALAARLGELGYPTTGAALNHVYDRFLKACENGQALDDDALIALALDNRPPAAPPYELNLVQAMTGSVKPASSTVQLKRDGRMYASAALGNGPVEASCIAIDQITGHPGRVVNFEIRAVGEGRDALGEVVLRVAIGKTEFTGRAVNTDIVEASVEAYLSAINKYLSVTPLVLPPQSEEVTGRAPELVSRRTQEEGRP